MILCSPAFAFESYFVMSELPIKNYSAENKNLVMIKRNVTLLDDKKTLILTPLKEGQTKIYIDFGENKTQFNIDIKKDSTTFDNANGLTFIQIEKPPFYKTKGDY